RDHPARRCQHAGSLPREPPAGHAAERGGGQRSEAPREDPAPTGHPGRGKGKDILWDIQRHFAQQAYLLLVSPSARVLAAWEPYVKNFAPKISLDYGRSE